MKKILFLLFIFPFYAQASGIILPNFHTVGVGERGSVLGGAVVARIDDASAAHYNPAGLAMLPVSTFSASASTFSSQNFSIEGVQSKDALDSVASFVGNVWKMGNFYFAFSLATPFRSTLMQQSKNKYDIPEGGYFEISDSYETSFEAMSPGITLAWNTSESMRMGASLKVMLFDIRNISSANLLTKDVGDDTFGIVTQNLHLTSSAIRGEYGIQKDILSNLRLGILLKTPTVTLNSDGAGYGSSLVNSQVGGNEYIAFSFSKAKVDFVLPAEIHLGLAQIEDNWDFEIDLKYSHSAKKNLLSGKMQETVSSSGGTLISGESLLDGLYLNEFSPTLNWSASASYRLSRSYLLSASFYTNKSPVKELSEDDDLFTKLDLYGATLGVTKFSEVSSTTIGLVVNQGKGAPKRRHSVNDALFEDGYKVVKYKSYGVIFSGSVYY